MVFIPLLEKSGSRSQGSVREKLHRTHANPLVPPLRAELQLLRGLELGRRHREEETERKLVSRAQLLGGPPDVAPVEVVGAGDPERVRSPDGAGQILRGLAAARDRAEEERSRHLDEDPGQGAGPVAVHGAARGIGRVGSEPGLLERQGVPPRRVPVDREEDQRTISKDSIQGGERSQIPCPLARHPAAEGDPVALLRVAKRCLDRPLETLGGLSLDPDVAHRANPGEKMDVGVHEARGERAALEVHGTRAAGSKLPEARQRTGRLDELAADQDRLGVAIAILASGGRAGRVQDPSPVEEPCGLARLHRRFTSSATQAK